MNDRLSGLMLQVLQAKAVDIRNVDKGDEPFLYSSGWSGPGYVMMKGLVGWKKLLKELIFELAAKVEAVAPHVGFVAGNVSGGVVPGWVLSEALEIHGYREVPFVYVRETRKKGGQKELITGLKNNPAIPVGANGLVVEELVNFAETTCNSAEAIRAAERVVTHAACLLFYNNPESLKSLERLGLTMIHLFTLAEILDVAEQHQTHPLEAIQGYREFLTDPVAWNTKRGIQQVVSGGTK